MITRRSMLGWLGAMGAALVGRKVLSPDTGALPPTNVVTVTMPTISSPSADDGERVRALMTHRIGDPVWSVPVKFIETRQRGVLVATVSPDTPDFVRGEICRDLLRFHENVVVVEDGVSIAFSDADHA